MRRIALAIGSLSCLSLPVAAEPLPPVHSLDNPAYSDPAHKWATVEDADTEGMRIELPGNVSLDIRDPRDCRDRIEYVRAANGQPPLLDREPASPDEAQAIYAVDRRQDGCSVMVMMGKPEEILPLPKPAEGPLLRYIPAADRAAAASDSGK
jgi:hypothetical protein